MPSMKRPAAAAPAGKRGVVKAAKPSAAAAAQRPQPAEKTDAGRSALDSIKEVLCRVEGYPTSVLEMLAASMDAAAVPIEERHPSQNALLDMVEEVLTSHVAAARGRVGAAAAVVGATVKECEVRQQAVHDAQSCSSAAAANLVEKKALGAHLAESLAAAKDAQSKAVAAEVQCIKALETKFEIKAGLAVVREKLAVLRSGSPEPSRAAVAKDVLNALKAYTFDDSMIASMSAVLVKDPDHLAEFDKLVLDQLDLELQRRAQESERECEKAVEARGIGVQAQQGATSEVEAAEERLQAAAAAVEAAKTNVANFDDALKAANVALQEEETNATASREELSRLRHEVEALESGVLRMFREVREFSKAPKPDGTAEGAAVEEPSTPAGHAVPEESAAEQAFKQEDTLECERAEDTIMPAGHSAPEGSTAEATTGITGMGPGSEAAEQPQDLGKA